MVYRPTLNYKEEEAEENEQESTVLKLLVGLRFPNVICIAKDRSRAGVLKWGPADHIRSASKFDPAHELKSGPSKNLLS